MKRIMIIFMLCMALGQAEQNRTEENDIFEETHSYVNKKLYTFSHHLDQKLLSYSDYFWENNNTVPSAPSDSEPPMDISGWFYGFFEDAMFDEVYTTSYARIRTTAQYDHKRNDYDTSVSLRLSLALPKITKRLNLYIDNVEESLDNRNFNSDIENSIGLRYRLPSEKYFHSSVSVGLHSLDNPYIRAYLWAPFGNEKWRNRLYQTLKYSHDNEFEDETGLVFDRIMDDNAMLRFQLGRRNSQYLYTVEKGDFFFGGLSFSKTTKFNRAYKIGTSVVGSYRPDWDASKYTLYGVYKQNIWRKWLFWEIEPRVEWEKAYDFDPNYVLLFSMEIHFGRDFSKRVFDSFH